MVLYIGKSFCNRRHSQSFQSASSGFNVLYFELRWHAEAMKNFTVSTLKCAFLFNLHWLLVKKDRTVTGWKLLRMHNAWALMQTLWYSGGWKNIRGVFPLRVWRKAYRSSDWTPKMLIYSLGELRCLLQGAWLQHFSKTSKAKTKTLYWHQGIKYSDFLTTTGDWLAPK